MFGFVNGQFKIDRRVGKHSKHLYTNAQYVRVHQFRPAEMSRRGPFVVHLIDKDSESLSGNVSHQESLLFS